MTFQLKEAAMDHILTVAHRGVSGGNIPCNTTTAYEIALRQGADMIEIDVDMSRDGTLVIFHPGEERDHLGCDRRIGEMDMREVSELRYVNYDRCPTQFGINTLDEVLETFRGRCFINVDKFWGHPAEIYEAIKRHGMQEQMLVKSTPSEKVFRVLEELAPDIPYMPIVRDTHPLHDMLLNNKIRYVGVEVLFEKDDAEVASEAFIERMRHDGILVWVNSIIYNHKVQLSGGHSDDASLSLSPEDGWGWLARRGFDLIQTDWTGMMIEYLKKEGLYFKR